MTDSRVESEDDLVEVARAHDRFEATVWMSHLEEQGMAVSLARKGGWIHGLLYLGRVPYAVSVSRRHQPEALAYLKKFRFI